EEAAAFRVSATSGKRVARRHLHFCEHDSVPDHLEYTYVRRTRQTVGSRRISGPAFLSMLSRDADLLPAAHVLSGRRHQSRAHLGDDAPREFSGNSKSPYRDKG